MSISSCSTSSDVTSNRFLQKRKYNKGFHVNLNLRANKHFQQASVERKKEPLNKLSLQPKSMNGLEFTKSSKESSLLASSKKNSANANFSHEEKGGNLGSANEALKFSSFLKARRDLKAFKKEWVKTETAKATASSPEAAEKNQIIAAILAFFVGWLGIHRFYMGDAGIGTILLLLGVGGFVVAITGIIIAGLTGSIVGVAIYVVGFLAMTVGGIWAIVDLVRILMGTLKPKNGWDKEI